MVSVAILFTSFESMLEGIVLGGYQFHSSGLVLVGGGDASTPSLVLPPPPLNIASFNIKLPPPCTLAPSLEQNLDLNTINFCILIPSLVQGEFWGS